MSTAFIYLRQYNALRADIYFCYPPGLILFAAGVIFISRGPLEGRVTWLGITAEYVSYLYFLMVALNACKQSGENRTVNNKEFLTINVRIFR